MREPGVRPFLKWAGGKTQLLPQLRRFYPDTFGAYFEPFLGSGAVFFDLHNAGLLTKHRVHLIDSNFDLIGTYTSVRDKVEDVIGHLEALAEGHGRRGESHFYETRDERFNPLRQQVLARVHAAVADYPPALAAMFIYLNRTGFNGLFRVNSKGLFNVPAGRYTNPRICDAQNLRGVSKILSLPDVTLEHGRFGTALAKAQNGDLVYLDPPYAPLSRTSRFTSYTAAGFTPQDQQQLQKVVVDLARRRCGVMLSNSTADEIRRLYERAASVRNAGLRAVRIPARRAINSRPNGRGAVAEYLITNLPQRTPRPSV